MAENLDMNKRELLLIIFLKAFKSSEKNFFKEIESVNLDFFLILSSISLEVTVLRWSSWASRLVLVSLIPHTINTITLMYVDPMRYFISFISVINFRNVRLGIFSPERIHLDRSDYLNLFLSSFNVKHRSHMLYEPLRLLMNKLWSLWEGKTSARDEKKETWNKIWCL